MLDLMVVVLLALLGGVSLGARVSTLHAYRRVSTLESRLSLLEERTRRLEEADRGLWGVLEERDSRLSLLESRFEAVEGKLGDMGSRLAVLSDLVETLAKQPEETPSYTKQPEEEEDPELLDMRILLLRKQGYSIRRIAQELGIPKSTVHKRLKKLVKARRERA